MSEHGEPVWEDGLGRKDLGARVAWEERTSHAPDPQALRFGEGECSVVVQAVIAGPVYRGRPHVDVYWHEGLRPSYMRLTPGEARRIGELLLGGAAAAERAGADV